MEKATNEASYKPLDTILVRTPLLPVETYQTDAPAFGRGEWIDAAITVASLSLARATRTERSAAPRLRYGIRMATRPTPYGIFSGVSLARWGDRTTLVLADESPQTRCRPDMAWLLRLVMKLEARKDIRRALTVRANTTALIRGGRIVLAERLTHAGDGAEPPRVSVRATSAARLVLRLARTPISYATLLDAVAASAPNVALERIETLLNDLLDQSLLITNLRPPLTCASPAEWLLQALSGIAAAQDVRRQLEDFLDEARLWTLHRPSSGQPPTASWQLPQSSWAPSRRRRPSRSILRLHFPETASAARSAMKWHAPRRSCCGLVRFPVAFLTCEAITKLSFRDTASTARCRCWSCLIRIGDLALPTQPPMPAGSTFKIANRRCLSWPAMLYAMVGARSNWTKLSAAPRHPKA